MRVRENEKVGAREKETVRARENEKVRVKEAGGQGRRRR